MKRVFFIDYENVDTKGLDGLPRLTNNDTVHIYYSESHNRLTWGLHRRICDSNAMFEYTKIHQEGKNRLDKELINDVKQTVTYDKRADYYIISKDRGYEKIVNELQKQNIKINLLSTISESNNCKKHELIKKIQERLVYDSNYNLSDEEINQIAKIIMESESKSEINIKLQKMFYNDDVKYIFSRIKDITYNL